MRYLLLTLLLAITACSSPFHKLAKHTEFGSEGGYVSVINPVAGLKSLTFGDFEFATSSREYRSLTGTKPPFRDILFYAVTREPEYEYYVLVNPRSRQFDEGSYSIRDTQIGGKNVVVVISRHAPVNDITFIKFNVSEVE